LEKEVFGTAKTGPVQGRIIALGSAVMDPNLGTPSKHAKPLRSETPQAAPQQQLSPEQPQQQQQSSYQPQQQQSSPPKKAENDVHVDYPAIDRLETQLLGRTYPSDSLKNRLARMELKAFGAVSSTDDLSGRREALEQYAKFYNGGTPQMGGAERPQTTPMQPQGTPSYARSPQEERSYSPHGHQRSAYDMYGPQAGSTPAREPAPVRRTEPREAPRRAPAAARVRKPAGKPAGNPDEMSPAQLEQWLKKQQN
jgi:hypothetical protein